MRVKITETIKLGVRHTLVTQGEEYEVKQTKKMCCSEFVDVGLKLPDFYNTGLFKIVCKCGKVAYIGSNNTAWINTNKVKII